MSIGERLRESRTRAGLTQEEAAERLQVTRQTLSNWENGRTTPDVVSAARMGELYGMSVDALLDRLDARQRVRAQENIARENRRLIVVCVLVPVLFCLFSLLTGGMRIQSDSFAIHGVAVFQAIVVVSVAAVWCGVSYVCKLRRRKEAVGVERLRDVVIPEDALHLCVFGFFTVCALFGLRLLW